MESEELSVLLEQLNAGDSEAFDPVVSLAYVELKKIAGAMMRTQRRDHTLQPTALVNEAWLRLASGGSRWESRAHFFGAAARAMRQVMVAYARQRSAKKRAADFVRVEPYEAEMPAESPGFEMDRLDEAMTALGRVDQDLLRVIELRYFAGCTLAEVADLLGCSPATVKRRWTYARAWLYDYMNT